MLVSLKELNGSTIKAVDGDMGQVKDVYFDDRSWVIRFLMIDTHPWLPLSQKVLISPIALIDFNAMEQALTVSMTKEKLRDCPKVEEHETVSREFEKRYFDYFGYGYYWTGAGLWGEFAYPTALSQPHIAFEPEQVDTSQITNHLRSANEISDYGMDAMDGKKGHVKDFIWDTNSWSLRYLVVDTRDWLPGGKKVLISPDQLNTLNWEDKTVSCKLDLAQIKACPEYNHDKLNDVKYLMGVREKLQDNNLEG